MLNLGVSWSPDSLDPDRRIREYVRNYSVATKRVLRAILKAADLCANDPAGAAQRLVAGGFTPRYEAPRYDDALETLSGIPYDKWREYDAEDSVRFTHCACARPV
jgi:NitT/TauT family transport system substrate-binding protein